MNYEIVSGLETHVELSTKTKIFCSCTTGFGGDPNTHCCPVCIGLPGTLPKLNREVVNFAIKAGLATHCTINNISKMDRKNYVYPDLPKAYQISQYDKPLCEHGYVTLSSGKKIRITRIHIEEDAGKLVHQKGNTYIDYNRGGVPLIEIVSEPDIRSIEEATEYLEKLQLIMRYLDISDCKMQEGSLRCDVNISVRPFGQQEYGTRTEIKNMNSFTNMAKAMEYEIGRQIELVKAGQPVIQETRRWNVEDKCTESMRGKEDAHDYRYFREPDLVTISVTDGEIETIKKSLPELPDSKYDRYVNELGIAPADALQIIKYRRVAEYFEGMAKDVKTPQTAANFMVGQVFQRFATEADKEACELKVPASAINELILLLDSGKVAMNLAKKTLDTMLDEGRTVKEILTAEELKGVDESDLTAVCRKVIDNNAANVADFLNGKEKALMVLVGSVMRETKGRADGASVQRILRELLKK